MPAWWAGPPSDEDTPGEEGAGVGVVEVMARAAAAGGWGRRLGSTGTAQKLGVCGSPGARSQRWATSLSPRGRGGRPWLTLTAIPDKLCDLGRSSAFSGPWLLPVERE